MGKTQGTERKAILDLWEDFIAAKQCGFILRIALLWSSTCSCSFRVMRLTESSNGESKRYAISAIRFRAETLLQIMTPPSRLPVAARGRKWQGSDSLQLLVTTVE